MRRIAGTLGLVLLAPVAVAAQEGCNDPSVTATAGAPSLEGYGLLFRQAGVAFYGRVPPPDSTGAAEVLIHNPNARPVEVSFSVEVLVAGEGTERAVSLGRHCASIPARGHALATDEAPDGAAGVRVRNLTIANLGPPARRQPPAQPGVERAEAPSTAPTPGPAGEPADRRSRTARPPEAGAAAPPPTPSAATAREASVPPAASDDTPRAAIPSPAAGDSRTAATPSSAAEPPATAGADVGRTVLTGVTTLFLVLSVVVASAAGLGLLLPVLAAVVLLAGTLLVGAYRWVARRLPR